MDNIQVMTPESLPELIDALNMATPDSRLIAGGTDLLILMREGRVKCDMLIDLSGVGDMNCIRAENGYTVIGANTTFTDLRNSQMIRDSALCLYLAAGTVGSLQIRNRATIGGNIANGSPAGDSLPALLILDAKIMILNSKGEIKELTLEKLLIDSGKTALSYDEVIVAVKFLTPGSIYRSTFVKIGSRTTVTIAKLSIAIGGDYDVEKNILNGVKIALGSVGRTALRFSAMETLLDGKEISTRLIDSFCKSLSHEIESAISGRTSMPYKREAVKAIASEAIESLQGNKVGFDC